MAEKSPTELIYFEITAFLDGAEKKSLPGSEAMHELMCIVLSSPSFVRDREYAVEVLQAHLGPSSHTGLSEASCAVLEDRIRPHAA